MRVLLFLFAMFFVFSCSGEGGSVMGDISRGGDVWDGKVSTAWYNASQSEFTLTEAQQFAGFAQLVNEGNGFAGKTVRLGADINLGGIDWTPIGTVTLGLAGTFDGNGYVIRGVFVNNADSSYQGLFKGTEITGEIKNLGVIDSDIRGDENVGGIAGYNNGKISDSYFIGGVSGNRAVGGIVGQNYEGVVSGSYSAGRVGGKSYVGGLVGYNYFAKITGSYSASAVSGKHPDGYSGKHGTNIGGFAGYNGEKGEIEKSYSVGAVMGDSKVGGFAGANDAGCDIIESYSIGAVSGNSLVGGFAGYNRGAIINSFYDLEKSGQSESSGGAGKSTAEMKDRATYAGWDFNAFWGLSDGVNSGYPYFK